MSSPAGSAAGHTWARGAGAAFGKTPCWCSRCCRSPQSSEGLACCLLSLSGSPRCWRKPYLLVSPASTVVRDCGLAEGCKRAYLSGSSPEPLLHSAQSCLCWPQLRWTAPP